jgi:hypothetical protein
LPHPLQELFVAESNKNRALLCGDFIRRSTLMRRYLAATRNRGALIRVAWHRHTSFSSASQSEILPVAFAPEPVASGNHRRGAGGPMGYMLAYAALIFLEELPPLRLSPRPVVNKVNSIQPS